MKTKNCWILNRSGVDSKRRSWSSGGKSKVNGQIMHFHAISLTNWVVHQKPYNPRNVVWLSLRFLFAHLFGWLSVRLMLLHRSLEQKITLPSHFSTVEKCLMFILSDNLIPVIIHFLFAFYFFISFPISLFSFKHP